MPHSPTPWPEPVYDNHGNGGFSEWWEISGIARVYDLPDAEFILRAVNCHDELVETLRLWDSGCRVQDGPPPDCMCYGCQTRAALAKAEAK